MNNLPVNYELKDVLLKINSPKLLVLLFCRFYLSYIVFLKMLRLQKTYISPLIGTTSVTQMVPWVSGLLFSPTILSLCFTFLYQTFFNL